MMLKEGDYQLPLEKELKLRVILQEIDRVMDPIYGSWGVGSDADETPRIMVNSTRVSSHVVIERAHQTMLCSIGRSRQAKSSSQ